MKTNKLICFDFDDTLFNTMKEVEGKSIWKEKVGTDWAHVGWWSKPESLDMGIFDIKVNDYVHNEYLKVIDVEDNHVILATGRLERLRSEVELILDSMNLTFKDVYLNRGGETFFFKKRLFEKLIDELKPNEFIMYDDRREHLDKFEIWATTIDCKITIVDVINKITKEFN